MLNRIKFITLLVCLVCWPALAWGQQEMRSATKGSSTPLPITGTSIDSNHNALDVNVAGGVTDTGEDATNNVLRVETQFEYEDVAASQTDQVMGSTGAAGDLLVALFCVFSADPSTAVSVKDGTGSAFTVIPDSGAAGFYNSGELNWISTDAGWKVTSGTNTTCRVSGRFN